MIGQLLGGYLGDRFDKRYLSVACMIAHAVALLGLAYAESTWQVVLLATVHGLAWGIRGPLMVALRATTSVRQRLAPSWVFHRLS